MRQNWLFVRTVGVSLFLILFSTVSFAQTGKITEGALRVIDAEGSSRGLCPLKRTEVKAEISGFLSRVTVTQTFQNPFTEKIEAVYTFPLPNDAAVDAMTILVGERIVKGKIMERQKALETYERAKQQGKVAALLEQQRPNIFTQAVANITPNAEIKVTISYVETLKYADDTYEFRFPMTIGERYIPSSVSSDDAAKISPKSRRRPGHTISMEVKLDAGVSVENIASNTHLIETEQFSPSRLAVKLKDENEIPNRDFVLRYKTAGVKIEDAILTNKTGRNGFFTLILQPPDRVFPADTTPKEIVFVLDTSGSMDGFPIKKAKEAMKLTLDNLNPQDTFNLITFAGETRILFDNPVPATRENLDKAQKMLGDAGSGGGTEMMQAIRAALAPSDSQQHVRIVCFMTDGQVGNEAEIIGEVQKHPQARVFAFGIGESVNHLLLDEISREGRGEVEYVGLKDDGSAAARRFYERIRNPLLTDISLEFQGVETAEVLPEMIPDLFDAKPVAVVGKYSGGGNGKVILRGKMQGQPFMREIAVNFPEQTTDNDALASLWARRKVAALTRRDYTGVQKNEMREDLQETITNLGLEFKILTPFTAFVAVDEQIVTDGTQPKLVEVPVAAPERERFIENYWQRRDPASNSTGGGGGGGGGTTAPVNNPTGGVTATVEVTADSSVSIDTADTKIDTNITKSVVSANPPVKGGSFQSPLSIAAEVTQTSESPVQFQQGLISSNGQRPTSNNFSVDGLSAATTVGTDETSLSKNAGVLPALTASGGTNSLLALDATQEVTIKTMSQAKEQRVAGAQVNFVSTGGTNYFHGSLFETFGNGALNANDFFGNSRALRRPPSKLNQFGGSFGGFLRRDKIWFFGNYEGLRLRQPAFAISEVPDMAARQLASPEIRPFLNAFPFPNGRRTANNLAEFAASYTNPAAHDIFGFRLDTQPTDKLRIGGRYNFADSKASLRGGRDFSLNTLRNSDVQTQSLSVWTAFTPTSTVAVTGGVNFSRTRIGQQFTIDDFGGAGSFPAAADLLPFDFLKFDFSGRNSALVRSAPVQTTINQFQANGALDWISQNHQLTFGGDFRLLSLDLGAARAERSILFGGVNFEGTASRIVEMERNARIRPGLFNFSLFAQDNWRIVPKLNLNLGVRWDTDFAPQVETQTAVFQSSTPQMPDSYKNFAPRAGFALDLLGDGKIALRGGAGLYYDYSNAAASEIFTDSAPFAGGRFARNLNFTATPTGSLNPLLVFAGNLKTPRTWHFFGEYQQEFVRHHILTVTYTASLGRKLFLTRTLSGSDPTFNFIRLTDNSARSDYHALLVRSSHRFSSNFFIDVRYTFSKSIDNYSPDAARLNNFLGSDLSEERGVSDFDARHQFSIFGSFGIPALFDSGWGKYLTKDWSIFAFANARTAFPINAGYFRVNDFGKELARPDVLSNVPLYLDENGLRRLNPLAFSIPNADRQGSLGRNALRGFPLFQLDASLQRRIRLGSNMFLNLSIQAFNLLNNTNFAEMSGNLGSRFGDGNFVPNSFFGQTASTFGSGNFTPFYLYGGARTVQFSAKFGF